MIDITYIGYSIKMIRLLTDSDVFCLKSIITKCGVIPKTAYNEILENDIIIDTSDDPNQIEKYIKCRLCLIYKYGHIVPNDIVTRYDFYNIHPGSIRTNRGAHPLRWSILLGQDITCLTLYQIDGVDEGKIVCEIHVNIASMDYAEADDAMDDHLSICVFKLRQIIEGDEVFTDTVKDGIYRNKLSINDYTIDIEKDTAIVADRKIRCVADFGGGVVVFDGIMFRAKKVISFESFYRMQQNETRGKVYIVGLTEKRWILECERYCML